MISDEDDQLVDIALLYEIAISNKSSNKGSRGLICSHCGKPILPSDIIEGKVILGDYEGYISHVNCLVDYIIKSEPIFSFCTNNGLVSESEIRADILNRPLESVILDLQRVCSVKGKSWKSYNDESFKYIETVGRLIESRSEHNLDIIEEHLNNLFPDIRYYEYN